MSRSHSRRANVARNSELIQIKRTLPPDAYASPHLLEETKPGPRRLSSSRQGLRWLQGMSDPDLYPRFLGPYGENDELLEKLVVEFLRDHVYWRRNFHPEDPPAIPTGAASSPKFLAFEARLRRELHTLSAALKRSVPFHSPRYLGHMVSDVLLPGLAAQILTLPYNPNNVSEDAAPVTVDLEVQVGLQLARLVGYPHDPVQSDCAFGHLTSGGTLANVQAMRLALALKAFPVALRAAQPPGFELPDDDWCAFNLPHTEALALLVRWQEWLASLPRNERERWVQACERERLETLGGTEFFARHRQLRPPLVLTASTAHYSWPKAAKLLGLGGAQCVGLSQRDMRLDIDALEDALARAYSERRPVLMTVAMLGTTEFGAVDPIDEVVALRDRYAARGFGFTVHVDAAWGGYLATLFRSADGTLLSREQVASSFRRFPSPGVYRAIAALAGTDSITIDPHKLGYLTYGAGAFVCRDHRAMSLLAIDADYVFTDPVPSDYLTRYRQLGRYIPEGSKPGAMAAAVYVTHRVMPLDCENFGKLPAQTLRAAEYFADRAERFAREHEHLVHACVPFAPDSNLVCLALNPRGNTSIDEMNRFVRQLHDQMRIDPHAPLQTREFFGSSTALKPAQLGPDGTASLLARLGLSHASWGVDDRLHILRHTLMNPFLIDEENGVNYIDLYFEFLARRIAQLQSPGDSRAPERS
jgi:glutamate/tyrosine decarboxylase-like PLP-dependent enzyme